METLERLKNLVKEVVELCESTEKETEQIRNKADEIKEYTYFMFCTELAPYRELAKEMQLKLDIDTGIQGEWVYRYEICFDPDGTTWLMANSFRAERLAYGDKDFYAYHNLVSGVKDNVYMIASNMNWEKFEANFAKAVETALTEKVKRVNEKKTEAEKYLASTL